MSLTRAQRKAIREAGPYRFDDEGVLLGGVLEVAFDQEREEAVLAALNEHVDTPESVAVARERILRLAVIVGKSTMWDDSLTNLSEACGAYALALRAAKKTRKR